jgi:hypothetical protein
VEVNLIIQLINIKCCLDLDNLTEKMKLQLGNNLKLTDLRKILRSYHTSTILNSEPNQPTTSLTGNQKVDSILEKSKNKLFEFMSIYEEAIGLKEIKEAQDQVLQVGS